MVGLRLPGANVTAPAVNQQLGGRVATKNSVVVLAPDASKIASVGGGSAAGSAGASGLAAPSDHHHPFPARVVASVSTPLLASGALWIGTVNLATEYKMLSVTCNVAARVRVYDRAAKALADQARPIGQNPTGDHGLMLEFVGSNVLTATCVPKVFGTSNDIPRSTAIPVAVTNLTGSAVSVLVQFTFVPQR